MNIKQLFESEDLLKNVTIKKCKVDRIYDAKPMKGKNGKPDWTNYGFKISDETGQMNISTSDWQLSADMVGKEISLNNVSIYEYTDKKGIKCRALNCHGQWALVGTEMPGQETTTEKQATQEPCKQPVKQDTERQRLNSMSIAYAKDLVVADRVSLANMLLYAKLISLFIETGSDERYIDEFGKINVLPAEGK